MHFLNELKRPEEAGKLGKQAGYEGDWEEDTLFQYLKGQLMETSVSEE